jgi:hypothetical protein
MLLSLLLDSEAAVLIMLALRSVQILDSTLLVERRAEMEVSTDECREAQGR